MRPFGGLYTSYNLDGLSMGFGLWNETTLLLKKDMNEGISDKVDLQDR